MLKSHEKFHSANGKRLVLVVDDEAINREILGAILADDYEVIFADNGNEALDLIEKNRETLSLVLLDLMMPVMGGMEVLKQMKEAPDPATRQIPVIVLTSEQNSEVESLSHGAIDFIPKPYPQPGVILARVRRTIELSEDRQIINSTERDPLTGLYNKEYFFRYAEQFDHHHRGMEMDAIVVDVNHFHLINERYGKTYGDAVLRRIGEKVREMVRDTGGIVCRREADTFLVYCPRGKDYEAILENASAGLAGDEIETNTRVRLRMGVYTGVDKELDVERRFDRAKMAADTIRNNFTRTIAFYDSALHESELYAEQLADDFDDAISERRFTVFYQPKFDVRGSVPTLSSAEALVRWNHPKLGMISPGVFIPLFEENGMICRLDRYVWRETAAMIRLWKDRFGFSVPVSVNVSRVDMFDPHLADYLSGLLREFSLEPEEFLLEITESAYTDDSELIIATVKYLRELGFRIEMDDFGTGYSSLGMISHLPMDALKLDMVFVRNAFNEKKDIRMLELILGIAEYLAVPVIAEGVETEEQMLALKAMGCDIVQGFYFSKPVPAAEFERFIEEKRRFLEKPTAAAKPAAAAKAAERRESDSSAYAKIAAALFRDYRAIYVVDTGTDEYVEYIPGKEGKELFVEKRGDHFFAECRREAERLVRAEDRARANSVWDKKKLLAALRTSGSCSVTYRRMTDGAPSYAHLHAVALSENGVRRVAIVVSDDDERVRREKEFTAAAERARRDELTGVKSRFAFDEAGNYRSSLMHRGVSEAFSVVLCNVGGLDAVSERGGGTAVDRRIRDACHVICNTFKHSPVFRVGGDEFAAILSGADYANRAELLASLKERGADDDGVVIACGISDMLPGSDTAFETVLARAGEAVAASRDALNLH
ncbi:MAG: EAL domain-containing protein [Bacillota bacterium]|jgi:diguanylate cyclase (GGDEF)-like protein